MEILNPKANQTGEISKALKHHQHLLQQNSKERYELIHRLVTKVSVFTESVEIQINPNALFDDPPH